MACHDVNEAESCHMLGLLWSMVYGVLELLQIRPDYKLFSKARFPPLPFGNHMGTESGT